MSTHTVMIHMDNSVLTYTRQSWQKLMYHNYHIFNSLRISQWLGNPFFKLNHQHVLYALPLHASFICYRYTKCLKKYNELYNNNNIFSCPCIIYTDVFSLITWPFLNTLHMFSLCVFVASLIMKTLPSRWTGSWRKQLVRVLMAHWWMDR